MTIGSSVRPLQMLVQMLCPQGPSRQASTSPVFSPAKTTRCAIVGEERTAACRPGAKSTHNGWQVGWPQPALRTGVRQCRRFETTLTTSARIAVLYAKEISPCINATRRMDESVICTSET